MASTNAAKTTLLQHLTGVAFLAGAILLVIAAFFLLLVAPVLIGVEGLKLWRRGELELLVPRHGVIIALSAIGWIVAITFSMLMSRSDKLNRDFDKSLRLVLQAGAKPFERESATASDIAGHLLERISVATRGLTFSDVVEEDYGAGFWASAGEDTFWVAVSAVGEDVEKPMGRFAINVVFDPGLSLLKRLRHRPDRMMYADLLKAVRAAVKELKGPSQRTA